MERTQMEYEPRLYLRQPIIKTLKNWRIILVVTLIFVVIFALYSTVPKLMFSKSAEMTELQATLQTKNNRLSKLSKSIDVNNQNIEKLAKVKDGLYDKIIEATSQQLNGVEELEMINNLTTELDDVTTQIENRYKKISKYKTEQTTINEEIEGIQSQISSGGIIYPSTVVQKSIIGGLLGMVLCFIVSLIKSVLDGKTHSRDEFENNYGLRILGWLSKPIHRKSPNKFEKMIYGLEDKYQPLDTLEMVASRIQTSFDDIEEMHSVVLTGTVSQKKLDAVKKALEEKLIDGKTNIILIENPAYSPSAVYGTYKKNVILVEENNKTNRAELRKLIITLKEGKAIVMGCVVI